MKKAAIFITLSFFACLFAFASCKKKADPTRNWTCTCIINYNVLITTYADTFSVAITNKSIGDAQVACPATETVTNHLLGQTLTGTGPCTLQ